MNAEKTKKWLKVFGPTLIIIVIVVVLIMTNMNLSARLNDLQVKYDEALEIISEEQKIDVTYIGNKLESINELATAKMTYNGIIHFKDGKIPLINKKEFYMAYRASVKAGFDLSKAEIQVTKHTVTINLPKATVYEPNVDETSFQFFDESFSLFNREKMTDLAQAITEAKADLMAQPETEELKQNAEAHVILLLTGLLESQIGDRELIINIG